MCCVEEVLRKRNCHDEERGDSCKIMPMSLVELLLMIPKNSFAHYFLCSVIRQEGNLYKCIGTSGEPKRQSLMILDAIEG